MLRHGNQQDGHEEEELTPRASVASLGGEDGGRLSRISCHTKYSVAINQIDRIEINSTYEREEDHVTMYVLDVYVWCVQTGIPTSRKQTSCHEYEDDPVLIKREREKNPHYRMDYRFSDFYHLRKELKEIVDSPADPFHAKWCNYCRRMNWLVREGSFPSRCAVDCLVTGIPLLRRQRIEHRKRLLTYFLDQIVHGTKRMQCRLGDNQCDAFVNVQYILKEFLSEPHVRTSCSGW